MPFRPFWRNTTATIATTTATITKITTQSNGLSPKMVWLEFPEDWLLIDCTVRGTPVEFALCPAASVTSTLMVN